MPKSERYVITTYVGCVIRDETAHLIRHYSCPALPTRYAQQLISENKKGKKITLWRAFYYCSFELFHFKLKPLKLAKVQILPQIIEKQEAMENFVFPDKC